MSLVKKTFTFNNEINLDCWIYIVSNLDNNKEFWFKAKDIATYLGYKKSKDAISNNVDKKWQRLWSEFTTTSNGSLHVLNIGEPSQMAPSNWQPHTVFISEPGLYALVMRSKKPEAVKFTHWIYEEVLPSLRSTGTYSVNPVNEINSLKCKNMEMKNRVLELKMENMETSQKILAIKSEAEKQIVTLKSEVLLAKSESEKLMLLTRMTNNETVRQLQSQFNESENRYKLLEYKSNLEIQKLRTIARTSVMEFAVQGLLARDNIEQNEILKSTLKRIAPRVVPEVKNPQLQDCVVVYRYTQNDTTFFKVIRGQMRYVESFDTKIAKYQLPMNLAERNKVKNIDKWLLSAVRIFKSQCANSTRCWIKFKQGNPDFIYGISLFNAATTFRYLNEIRQKYQIDLRNL